MIKCCDQVVHAGYLVKFKHNIKQFQSGKSLSFSDNFRAHWGEMILCDVAHDYKSQLGDTQLLC